MNMNDKTLLDRLEAEREPELIRLAKNAAEAEGTVAFIELVQVYETLHGESLDLPDG